MWKLIFYAVFLISVGMAAAGTILASRLRSRYKSEIISDLIYYQVFIYTFGFYVIWGQVAIDTFLSQLISQDLIKRFTDISILLGLPFLVFAWLMLIRVSRGLSGRSNTKWLILWFLLLNFSLLVILGYLIIKQKTFNSFNFLRIYFIAMNLLYSFLASYIIHFSVTGREVIHEFDRKVIAPALFLIMIIQCVPLIFYSDQQWIAILFIIGFFAGNSFLPFYLNYGTLVPEMAAQQNTGISFEEFCNRFDISSRESDIIREICNGLSNKEISGKLFISLQTVKDHTHRIYIKTNVRSRVQLINVVREYKI
jgi:DNA-binding CsgD family transcriptional regulator